MRKPKVVFVRVRKSEIEQLKTVEGTLNIRVLQIKNLESIVENLRTRLENREKEFGQFERKLQGYSDMREQALRDEIRDLRVILAGAVCKENPFTKEVVHVSAPF